MSDLFDKEHSGKYEIRRHRCDSDHLTKMLLLDTLNSPGDRSLPENTLLFTRKQ